MKLVIANYNNIFEKENIHFCHKDTDSFVLSVNAEDIIKDSKNLEDLFDFSNLSENKDLFSNQNKKVN